MIAKWKYAAVATSNSVLSCFSDFTDCSLNDLSCSKGDNNTFASTCKARRGTEDDDSDTNNNNK